MSFMKNQLPKISKPPTSGEAKKIISRDVEVMSRSYRRAFPLVIKSIQGPLVEDINGNVYIDFTAGFGALPLGGSHPKIIEALRDQVNELPSYSLRAAYFENALNLVEEISKIVPIRRNVRAILTNSGAEAVDIAMRALRWHSGKNVVVSFIGAYHGSTIATLGVSSDTRARRISTRVNDAIYAPNPYCFRCLLGLDPENCGLKCLDYLEELAEKLAPSDVAAVLIEPIQVEAGVIVPPEKYFEKLTRILKKIKALFIADEVFTAPARTGRWFAIDHWNVNADAVCLGAQLSSGLPLGILLAREDLLDLEPGMHEPDIAGLQLSITAALATLQVIKEEGLVERSERLGRILQKRLRDLVEESELSWRIRGRGMLVGIEVVGEDEALDEMLARKIVDECFRIGLLTRRKGPTVILTPPLNIEEEVLERGLQLFEEKVLELSRRSRASSS